MLITGSRDLQVGPGTFFGVSLDAAARAGQCYNLNVGYLDNFSPVSLTGPDFNLWDSCGMHTVQRPSLTISLNIPHAELPRNSSLAHRYTQPARVAQHAVSQDQLLSRLLLYKGSLQRRHGSTPAVKPRILSCQPQTCRPSLPPRALGMMLTPH